MTGKLQYGDIGIEVKAVDAFTLESDVLVEYSVDVRHGYLLDGCNQLRKIPCRADYAKSRVGG